MNKFELATRTIVLQQKVAELLEEKVIAYIKSGALDLEAYGDDYELPRILVHAALKDIAATEFPLTGRGAKEVNNLLKF